MEATAKIKSLRSSPQKARLVADEIRGVYVSEALGKLDYSINKKVARDISKLIKSAVANLQSKNEDSVIDADDLRVFSIRVDQGPVLKRFRPRAQGRVGKIIKRMCHISVTVSDK